MPLKEDGDRQRFRELTYPHMRLLFGIALKYTGNAFDAEDLVQETYLTAFHKFHQLKDPERCKSWMLKILRNNFLKNCQKAKFRQRVLETDYLTYLRHQVRIKDTDDMLIKGAESRLVRQAIERLPAKYREVLRLYYMDDMLYKDIARTLNIPMGTVMSRLTRAREGLKAGLLKNQLNNGTASSGLRH